MLRAKIFGFCEHLSRIKVLSAKLRAKYSQDIPFTSAVTVSHTSIKNSPLSPVVSLPLAMLSATNPSEVANNDITLCPSVGDSDKSYTFYGIFQPQSNLCTTCFRVYHVQATIIYEILLDLSPGKSNILP
ncbi:unnamed protein product [Hymenolepis diminuta]|uniref:Uncharacterized protein n=1 Tax=Hymenolepis diminuta TaxID=6216 RepID=A0A564YEL2_HYMDI|nr:unnamed protein product [Hymenolepis diminuta]